MAGLGRSQGTGAVGVRDTFQGTENRTLLGRTLPTPQPPWSPTYAARGDVCPPLASTSCFSSWFRFPSLLPYLQFFGAREEEVPIFSD